MTQRLVALVTGASRGIGAAIAIELAQRGYDLTLLARTKGDLESVAHQVENAGGSALIQCGDLGDLDFAQRAVKATVEHFGHIDALINNAAWREIVTMRTISIASWEKTIRISLTAPAFLTKWAAADMEKRQKGVIIHVSSIQSQMASGIAPAYIASKGALDALTNELAILYGPRGIRVISLRPGAIDTEMSGDYETADGQSVTTELRRQSEDMIPLRRWARSEEIAKTIAFLVSDDASYITAATILADGGLQHNMLPYTLKHKMFPGDYD